ncbi:MAG: glutaminyl-peptide cyclotransferase [Fibrobacteria bacterium]|nr:glutaminyl-peptide cyclotransferase [Fibrobacteria bacterium]
MLKMFMYAFFLLVLSLEVYAKIPSVQVEVVNVLPHPGEGFTQGLFYHEGLLYEGTGLYHRSSIASYQLNGASFEKVVSLPRFFGEGITLFKNKLYQLTWKAGRLFVYDFPGMELSDSLSYKGDGWGLTSDGTHFIMGNGSDTLYFRDSNFQVLWRLPVRSEGLPVTNLNELEYTGESILANIWFENHIVDIDPQSGEVKRHINCDRIFQIENPQRPEQVLNGIAFNPETKTLFLTGKYWKYIFEVKVPGL